ncbi:hypothetical protein QIS99_04950 [Streptomyces sp. B-S-A8]|uniref:Lipoprotein n=1 Tax=Streptomyces solicavernae TaxID=3043614 RepID=A0ABT6RMA2_9ACTN|nr:hypothetical protein [Streptomyces sp. B-S-A8]MDI3385566.1 hypothetical protein [Streptomyces sp. B-S-A8]
MTAPTRTRARLGPVRAALATLLAAGAAGCGIRATEVPTDFGPAPSRVPCVSTAADVTTRTGTGTLPEEIFLVCGSQLVRVDRAVRISATDAEDPVKVAQALLAELREPLTEAEEQAGFTSDVKGDPKISGPRGDDPPKALRISTPPERMSPYELAQIVCTFAQSVAAERDDSVLLGGTGQDSPLRRYECTDELRSRPGTVPAPAETVTP